MIEERLITSLRDLRGRAQELNESLADDLKPFLHERDLITFRRLPSSKSDPGDVNPTTTCTALMALAANYKLEEVYGKKQANDATARAFESVVTCNWKSSGLKEGNAFTKAMVLRTAGILVTLGNLDDSALDLRHRDKTLSDVAKTLASRIPTSLAINYYSPTATLGYWFVDALTHLPVTPTKNSWHKTVAWVASDFRRQLSLVEAGKDALMDPVALAMASCLARRLSKKFLDPDFSDAKGLSDELPSAEELEHAVRLLFKYQAGSGIWPKYFPLFHYPKAGANFCFSFELLEAVLREFEGSSVLREADVIHGLERAVSWCQQNRLEYQFGGKLYAGWNSGGETPSLTAGIPESWATGVVHMFLYQLRQNVSEILEQAVLQKYGSRRPKNGDSSNWDRLIDAPLELSGTQTTVKRVIEERILRHAATITQTALRSHKLKRARSALLFGPPGTSKTSLVKAIAKKLGWPLVELNPSHFLKKNLENIFMSSVEIFDDLSDVTRAVVFFDEMDAVAQRRKGRLDVTRQLLTTSMLPKITRLYESGRALFFMATNHIGAFDDAITRAGRFDLLICVGPPNWRQKIDNLEKFLDFIDASEEELSQAADTRNLMQSWIDPTAAIGKMLDLFTFDEFASLLNQVRNGGALLAALEGLGKDAFQKMVEERGGHIRLRDQDLKKKNSLRWEYDEDMSKSAVQY